VTIACRARRCQSGAEVSAAESSLNPLYMKLSRLIPLCLFPLVASLASCKEKGPAEKAGENVDEAIENVKDAVDPKGPAEKAGEKVDDALGK